MHRNTAKAIRIASGKSMKRIPYYFAALTGAGLLLQTVPAMASGFMVRENSAEAVATAYAGNGSRADDVSTVFNNPAGMSWLRGTQFEAGAAVVFPNMKFNGSASIAGNPIPGTNDRSVGQIAAIPHLYGVFDITDRIKAGLALTVPFGNTVDYAEDWPGRYVNIKTAAIAADINPNIAFRVNDRLSIGGGFSAQYLKLDLSSSIAQFAIFGPGTPDGGYLLRAKDWSWGFNLGILAEPWDGTRVGLTYRSRVSHQLEGDLTFSPATSPLLGLTDAPASADINLPATFGGSVTQQITPDLSISSDVQFTQWHTFKQVAVFSPPNPVFTFTENYRDSWMVSVGGVYRLDQQWLLRAGVGYDESPVTDAYRDTGVPDKDRYMVGIGAGFRVTPASSIDFGYAHYFAAGHATMDSSINATDPITGVVLTGRYTNSLDYVSLTLRTAM
jgi:long-chain fatty acid transport protein